MEREIIKKYQVINENDFLDFMEKDHRRPNKQHNNNRGGEIASSVKVKTQTGQVQSLNSSQTNQLNDIPINHKKPQEQEKSIASYPPYNRKPTQTDQNPRSTFTNPYTSRLHPIHIPQDQLQSNNNRQSHHNCQQNYNQLMKENKNLQKKVERLQLKLQQKFDQTNNLLRMLLNQNNNQNSRRQHSQFNESSISLRRQDERSSDLRDNSISMSRRNEPEQNQIQNNRSVMASVFSEQQEKDKPQEQDSLKRAQNQDLNNCRTILNPNQLNQQHEDGNIQQQEIIPQKSSQLVTNFSFDKFIQEKTKMRKKESLAWNKINKQFKLGDNKEYCS